MSRKKTSRYLADPVPTREPFFTPERKRLYILLGVVDGTLLLTIALVAFFRFLPLYPTAPAIAFVMVVFNYALMFLKRDIMMPPSGKR
jgi:hypothetical protein